MYNEAENAERVIKEIGATLEHVSIPYEILCVSNNSTDGTDEILDRLAVTDARIRPIHLPMKGYGIAVIHGLNAAEKDLVTIVSGDGQVSPRDILTAYKVMENSNVDIVRARRVERRDGVFRIFQSSVYNVLLKTLFALPGWDFNSPPKVIKREFVRRLNLQSQDWFVDPEIMIKTKYLRGSVAEAKVTYGKRAAGAGKVKLSTACEFFKNMIIWRVRYRELVRDTISGSDLKVEMD
jgi:dolichol-phosphate mannosyltransferase